MKQRKIPMRRCTGCLEMKNKKELIRVVRTENPEDNPSAEDAASKNPASVQFSLDFTGKKSGRGAYICPNQDCLEKARKQKGLERSFKHPVPAEVYDQLQVELDNNGS